MAKNLRITSVYCEKLIRSKTNVVLFIKLYKADLTLKSTDKRLQGYLLYGTRREYLFRLEVRKRIGISDFTRGSKNCHLRIFSKGSFQKCPTDALNS